MPVSKKLMVTRQRLEKMIYLTHAEHFGLKFNIHRCVRELGVQVHPESVFKLIRIRTSKKNKALRLVGQKGREKASWMHSDRKSKAYWRTARHRGSLLSAITPQKRISITGLRKMG
jgi:dTDP-D-glucose 4,6-dehydratase